MSALSPLSPTLTDSPCDPRGLGGLEALVAGAARPLPLQAVRVRARILGGFAHTEVEQVFANPLSDPLEAVYRFPLPPGAAVQRLSLRCGELVIEADLKAREAAQAEFEAAREAGHRAALLTQERDDVHTLRITRLPPGEGVAVALSFVQALDCVDGAWRWRFPTTIAPRYLPGQAVGHAGDGSLPDTDRVPDGSQLQPPLRLAGGTPLDLEVLIHGPVAELESSLHAVKLGLADGGLRVAPSGKASLNADFILAITPGDPAALATQAWTDGQHTLLQVAPPLTGGAACPRDAVFVVDISGSMSGTKLAAAKAALHTALHGLMDGDRFRLIAFDDRLEHFSPDFCAYDARTLAMADRWVDDLPARGGTEMLPAIQAALAGETPAGRLRTVLFITDGQAWNEQELVAAVGHRRGEARFFTLGIDTAVNEGLLGRLARVGGGICELATPRDDIEAVVARMEARFGGPLVIGLRADRPAAHLGAADVFAGRPALLLLEGQEPVRATAVAPEGFTISASPTQVDFPLGALWAKDRIAALEDRLVLRPFEEEALRPEITALSLRHRVISRFTALVAVERSRTVGGALVTVAQPSELPQEWDTAAFGALPGAAPPASGGGRGSLRKRTMPPPSAAAPARLREESARRFQDGLGAAPLEAKAEIAEDAWDAEGAAPPSVSASAPPPPPAPRPAPAARQALTVPLGGSLQGARQVPGDPAAALAHSQGADGSFGGDLARTAAALLLLLKLGHTRRKGLRKRTVQKAAAWLATQGDPLAAAALAALAATEAGAPWPALDLAACTAAQPEGAWLAAAL